MLMKRDEGEGFRPPQWELEDGSLDELSATLTEGTISRAQALKLGGAALLAETGLTMLFQSPADARRKKKITANPEQPKFEAPAGGSDTKTVTITNHQDGTSAYLLPGTGSNDFSFTVPGVSGPITEPLEIAPGAQLPVTVTFTPNASVQSGSLTIVDADVEGEPLLSGDPLEVVPLKGVVT